MTSSLPCKDCASGVLHEGTPTGREETVHGLNTYVTHPPSGSSSAGGIVVIIPDLFGWKLNNSRVLADRYAERGGYTVYVPDFMDGMFWGGNNDIHYDLRFLWRRFCGEGVLADVVGVKRI